MYIRNYYLLSLLALLFLALPASASAASVSFRISPARIGAGDTVRIDVFLSSAAPTNAFSGTLSYSKTLQPVAVSDGNSIISLWITHPAISAAGASIPFAGVTPGGFSGDRGLLFSVVFRAAAAGDARISLADLQVLRNDGSGGVDPTTAAALSFSVGAKPLGGYTEPADSIPPEAFTASLGNDPQLFDGRNYLVFTAVDKGSGIDRYAVAESRLPSFLFPLFPLSWHDATSPYKLVDQALTSTIYIKAVDRAGNERVSVYPPRRLFTTYELLAALAILLGVVLLYRREWGRRLGTNS